jgi:hypothetical protein
MKTLKEKLNQGFSNFFSLKPNNIAIGIVLIIILVLSFKSSRIIDLFNTDTPTSTPGSNTPTTTLSAADKLNKSRGFLQAFIAQLNGQTFNANKYQKILNQRQDMINKIQNKQTELNASTYNAINLLNSD